MMLDTRTFRLHSAIALVAPITGVCVKDWSDRSTWDVTFDNPTPQQKKMAAVVITNFDPSAPDPAEERAELFKKSPDLADLHGRLKNATPAQIDAWVDGASAQTIMKMILKSMALDIRR